MLADLIYQNGVSAPIHVQESCAIAKMTAQCAPYMGALRKFSGLPDYAHGYFSQNFSWAFVPIHLVNVCTSPQLYLFLS